MAPIKKWKISIKLPNVGGVDVYVDAQDSSTAVKIAKAQYPTATSIGLAHEVK